MGGLSVRAKRMPDRTDGFRPITTARAWVGAWSSACVDPRKDFRAITGVAPRGALHGMRHMVRHGMLPGVACRTLCRTVSARCMVRCAG